MLVDNSYLDNTSNSDPVDEFKEKQKIEKITRASLYLETFSTDAGQKVLKDLVDMYLNKKIALPNDNMMMIGIRQGKADLVRDMIRAINSIKGD